jgi:hypothetical protein
MGWFMGRDGKEKTRRTGRDAWGWDETRMPSLEESEFGQPNPLHRDSSTWECWSPDHRLLGNAGLSCGSRGGTQQAALRLSTARSRGEGRGKTKR